MKLKDEKGFSGIDITVAVIIIMLFMSLVGTVFYNITISSKALERKTEATYIAVDVIEKIKALDYDGIIVGEYNDDGINYTVSNLTGILKNNNQYNPTEGYSLSVKIENYNPDNESDYDLVKIINVKVEYKVGKNIENVELNTTVTRES